MTFKGIIQKLDSNVWSHCVFVPLEYSEKLIEGTDRRVICTINDNVTIHAALMPNGGNEYFINLNKDVRKELGVDIGSTIEISLKKDTCKYGMPMPLEFQELLEQDELGNTTFHSLTIGKQRNLIHIVGKFKSEEKRIEKSIIILEYLKSVNGKLDFKELNLAFKNSSLK